MHASAGASFAALRPRNSNADRATENSVQARRAERPRSRPYATCWRRAGTLTIFCGDFLHHLDLDIALCYQFFQPRILRLELPQVASSIRSRLWPFV
jgi:hypothetical protein